MSNLPARDFTPAALSDIRYRYVETDEPQQSIADDYRMNRTTLFRMAKRLGWPLRKDRATRDAPPGAGSSLDEVRTGEQGGPAPPAAVEVAPAQAQAGSAVPAAERLERMLEQELSRVERMRVGRRAHSPADSERMARTLQRLTDALIKVRNLRASEPNIAGRDQYDDWPEDIDAFRNELARRIRVFVAARKEREALEAVKRGDEAATGA